MEVRVNAHSKHSRLEPELMPRRDILGLASILAAAGAALFATIGMLRLPKAAVLASPSKKFRVALPENLTSTDFYIPPGRNAAISSDEDGAYAVSLVCTHLGCIVKPAPDGFECPCHGSRFDSNGFVTKGPAPRGLPWLKVAGSGNQLIVDEGVTVPPGTKMKS
jgi:Rieske Fe-S protein